jgi:rhomboid protease GluP
MAIGLIPKYKETYPLAGLTQQQFLILAMEAAARLAWRLYYLSATGFVAAASPKIAELVVRLDGDTASLSSASVVQELTDRGRNKANIRLFIATLEDLRSRIPAEQLTSGYEQLLPMLPPPEQDALLHPPAKARSAAADILAIFRPAEGYFITPVILNLNLLIFLLMGLSGVDMLEPRGRDLLAWGANFEPLTLGGEWWRLITCCFIHIGILHLAMNMYAFLLIGAQLEPRLGKTRFLIAYALGGLVASATSLWWHDGNSISAGASGAIFGMYGVFLVMLSANLVERSKKRQLLASIIFFIVYNLLGGLKAGIDNAAHIGGLVAGIGISAALLPALRKKMRRERSAAEEAAVVVPPTVKNDDYY